MFFFFFSSRRRHTRCALVTGVQTCALPIYRDAHIEKGMRGDADAVLELRQHAFLAVGVELADRVVALVCEVANREFAVGGVEIVDIQPVVEIEIIGELGDDLLRSEEHTSELQSLMRSSYAVLCLKKK